MTGVKKYRKRPVVIEAIQYKGYDNYREVCNFVGKYLPMVNNGSDPQLLIPTLEGDVRAKISDYIIKGVAGEFYPCDEEIFYETYDKVEGEM